MGTKKYLYVSVGFCQGKYAYTSACVFINL